MQMQMPQGNPLLNNQGQIKVVGNYSYNVKHCLGCGQFGTVYEGQETTTKEKVAIKKLDVRQFQHDKYLRNAIVSEIKILKQFNHPNIVKFHDMISTKNSLYIVTELCEGGDLSKVIQKQKLSEKQCIDIIRHIIEGFKTLATQGVIHRDLKPANILVNQGVYKIADFGFAKYVDNSRNQLMTTCVGSPLYMSPQILQKKQYTTKCDIWSLGIIYHELLFGKTPWYGNSDRQLLQNIMTQPFKNRNNKISKFSQELLSRSLQVHEHQRMSWTELFKLFENLEISIKQQKAAQEQKQLAQQQQQQQQQNPQQPQTLKPHQNQPAMQQQKPQSLQHQQQQQPKQQQQLQHPQSQQYRPEQQKLQQQQQQQHALYQQYQHVPSQKQVQPQTKPSENPSQLPQKPTLQQPEQVVETLSQQPKTQQETKMTKLPVAGQQLQDVPVQPVQLQPTEVQSDQKLKTQPQLQYQMIPERVPRQGQLGVPQKPLTPISQDQAIVNESQRYKRPQSAQGRFNPVQLTSQQQLQQQQLYHQQQKHHQYLQQQQQQYPPNVLQQRNMNYGSPQMQHHQYQMQHPQMQHPQYMQHPQHPQMHPSHPQMYPQHPQYPQMQHPQHPTQMQPPHNYLPQKHGQFQQPPQHNQVPQQQYSFPQQPKVEPTKQQQLVPNPHHQKEQPDQGMKKVQPKYQPNSENMNPNQQLQNDIPSTNQPNNRIEFSFARKEEQPTQ